MRGSHNATELVPILPFWLNSEKICVESNSRVIYYLNQTMDCRQCSPVPWENTLTREFLDNGKLEKMTNFGQKVILASIKFSQQTRYNPFKFSQQIIHKPV